MKKKILKKFSRNKQPEAPVRITNETVAEHRERILAGGRRFKYPIQYARHRLVFNAVILIIITVILIVAVSWWQLYKVQNTGTFFYRVAKTLPLPVASVDGESVKYGDYLMRYRSQEHWLREKGQVELTNKDGQRQLEFIKRGVINGVEADAYAAKLARNLDITVTEAEIDSDVDRSLETANGRISQELYDASTLDTFGYTRDEYRLIIRQSLIRQKVAYTIDTQATQKSQKVQGLLKTASPDFSAIAKQAGGTGDAQVAVGASGLVRKNNQDGGLSAAALKLKVGEISSAVQSTTGDGYYFVRLLSLTSTQLSYEYIRVPLTKFSEQLAQLKKDGKIIEYISIQNNQTQTIKQP